MNKQDKEGLMRNCIAYGMGAIKSERFQEILSRKNTSFSEDPHFSLLIMEQAMLTHPELINWLYENDYGRVASVLEEHARLSKQGPPDFNDLCIKLIEINGDSDDVWTNTVLASAQSAFFDDGACLAIIYLERVMDRESVFDIYAAVGEERLFMLLFIAMWNCNYENFREMVASECGNSSNDSKLDNATKNVSYVDFRPADVWDQNSNGVDMAYRMLNEGDQAWLTQGTSSVLRWESRGGNGYYSAVVAHLSEDDKDVLSKSEQGLQNICRVVAEFTDKEYDVTYDYSNNNANESYTYKGWILERLYRKEVCESSTDILYMDYCLGADGRLYTIVSDNKSSISEHLILECICYSPAFLSVKFSNVYSAAISGVIGVLDAVPIDKDDPRRNKHLRLDMDYYYNFPVQLDDERDFPYEYLWGVILRLARLLSEDKKTECCNKYEWMRSFLYPENQLAAEEKENTLSTQEKFSNASHGYDFNEYVLFGATEVSKKPYAQKNDEFRTDANGCFLSAFLTERLVAADDLLKLYPKFNNLVTAIIDNQQELTGEKLFAERQLATDISNEYSENGNVPESIFILLTAYAAFLSQGSTDKRNIIITKMMVDRVCTFNIVKGGWEEILIAVILWFSDRDGYREAVVNKYIELMNQPVAEPGEYVDKIDVELYARIGAQFYGQYDGGIDLRFVSALIQYKLPVAEKVAKEFPSFAPICEYIRANNDQANLAGDFDEVFKAPELFVESVDCAILVAALGTFLDRGNPDRGTSEACIVCVERALNKPGEEVVGLPSIVLLCVALWFSDYKGYKVRVYEHIKMLVAENWYSEGTNIDLNEVRESIDNSKFN